MLKTPFRVYCRRTTDSQMTSGLISYESLLGGEGQRLFGDSWTVYNVWLTGLRAMDAPLSHKVWSLTSLLSMHTNAARRNVYVPRLGHVRLNLGIMFIGSMQTVIENLIDITMTAATSAAITLAPADTDGHRQGFITALSGFNGRKRSLKAPKAIGPSVAAGKVGAELGKRLQEILSSGNTEEALRLFAESDASEDIKSIENFEVKKPAALIAMHLRNFLKDSYSELTNLLVQCLLNQRIDIQQQQHRYIIPETALSILVGANIDDLLGRAGYVNKQFLANMIPVYNAAYYGTAHRMPDVDAIRTAISYLDKVQAEQTGAADLTLSSEADAELAIVGEARIMTTDLNLIGLSDRRIYHLIRIAGILAYGRRDTTVSRNDIRLAHTMLALNENTVESCYSALMAERGDARLFLRMIEYLEVNGAVDPATLAGFLKQVTSLREMDILDAVNRFFLSGRVVQTEEGLIKPNSEGAQLRLEALTKQMRKQ